MQVVLLCMVWERKAAVGHQMQALGRAGYRPIAPDLPGFGNPNSPVNHWSISLAARMIC